MSLRSNVDARRLNERVTIQRKVTTQSPTTGEVTHTWQTVLPVWAAVDSARVDNIAASVANETEQAGAITASRFYTVWIRYRAGIDSNMRIVRKNGAVLDIKGIPDNGKTGRLMALFCYEGLNDG